MLGEICFKTDGANRVSKHNPPPLKWYNGRKAGWTGHQAKENEKMFKLLTDYSQIPPGTELVGHVSATSSDGKKIMLVTVEKPSDDHKDPEMFYLAGQGYESIGFTTDIWTGYAFMSKVCHHSIAELREMAVNGFIA